MSGCHDPGMFLSVLSHDVEMETNEDPWKRFAHDMWYWHT